MGLAVGPTAGESPAPQLAGCVAFSPGGHLLASGWYAPRGSKHPVIQLWEPASGAAVAALTVEVGGNGSRSIHSAAFSPDGRLLAIAASDGLVRLWDVFGGKELAAWKGHTGEVTCVAFSPDGRTLASGSSDTTILLWDVSKVRPMPPPFTGGAKEIANLAAELAGKDSAKAFRAAWALAGAGDKSVAALRTSLRPAAKLDADQVRRLIAQLNDDERERRDEASAALEKLGPAVAPALKPALANAPPAETRRRLRRVLERLAMQQRDQGLHPARALLVVELIGSAAAQKFLKELAAGEPDAEVTRAARSALDRLGRTAKPGR